MTDTEIKLGTPRSLALAGFAGMDALGSAMASIIVTLNLAQSRHPWLIGVQLIAALAPRAILGKRVARWLSTRDRNRTYLLTQFACTASGALMLLGLLGGGWQAFFLIGILLVNTFKLADNLLMFEAIGGLEKSSRERQVSRFSTARSFASIFGAPLGAVIWSAFGAQPALLLNVLSFALPLLGYSILAPLLRHSHAAAQVGNRSDTAAAFSMDRDVRLGVVLYVAFGLLSSVQSPATVKLVTGPMGLGTEWYGYLEAVWGIGAVLASAWSAKLQKNDKLVAMLLYMGLYAIGLSVLGFIPRLAVAVPAYFFAAGGLVLANIAFTNFLYDRVPAAERFAIRATSTAWQSGALAVGFAIGGAFIGHPQALTVISGVTCLILTAGGFVARSFLPVAVERVGQQAR